VGKINNKGILIIVSAPSGCGKGTILAEILKDEKFFYSISATTRSPRQGEEHGREYYFLSRKEFEQRIRDGEMLEYAEYCDNYYGTPLKEVEAKLEEGFDVVLEIETAGALQVMEKYPDALSIFIAPPSFGELRMRLAKRGTETQEQIEARIFQAETEMKYAVKYKFVIVNNMLEDAIEAFKNVVRGYREELSC